MITSEELLRAVLKDESMDDLLRPAPATSSASTAPPRWGLQPFGDVLSMITEGEAHSMPYSYLLRLPRSVVDHDAATAAAFYTRHLRPRLQGDLALHDQPRWGIRWFNVRTTRDGQWVEISLGIVVAGR